uniref:Uncharacterized protein n=1 Tax=Romanomermis culicivorax TaxID=13658 RepID=A0A915K5G9_ROMCU
MGAVHMVIFALSMERLCASVYYKHYDYLQRIALPLILFCSAMIIMIAMLALVFFVIPDDEETMMSPCDGLQNSGSTVYGAIFTIGIEKIATIIYIYIHFSDRNKYRHLTMNQAQNRLMIRFQLSFNLQINETLLPSTFASLICFIIADLGLFASVTSYKEQAVYSNLTLFFGNLNIMIQPLILFLFNKWFRKLLKDDFNKFIQFFTAGCNENRVGCVKGDPKKDDEMKRKADAATKIYFDNLSEIWNQDEFRG